MKFNMTRAWLLKKLAELDEAGVDEIADVGPWGDTSNVQVVAKMRCNSLTVSGMKDYPSVNVQLGAVYSNDPDSENCKFANATPSASVNMNIDAGRPAAHAFELGADYYVQFIPLGQPKLRYIKDGIPPARCDVVLTKKGGEDPIEAVGNVRTLTFSLSGEEITEDAWQGNILWDAGYRYWKHPDSTV